MVIASLRSYEIPLEEDNQRVSKKRQIPDSDGIEYEPDQVFLMASDFDLLRKIKLAISVS